MRHQSRTIIAILFCLAAGLAALVCLAPFALAKNLYPTPVVSGSVTDHMNRPLKGVRIYLSDKDSGQTYRGRTNRRGKFSIKHKRCDNMFLRICPASKTGLASAAIDDVEGDSTRKVVVHLKRGFHIKGKITHQKRGLKGMTIKVRSKDNEDIHSGGQAVSNRKGNFRLTVTPGYKELVVINKHFDDLVREHTKTVHITSDTILEDLEIPLNESFRRQARKGDDGSEEAHPWTKLRK